MADYDCVLIDDDSMILMLWREAAKAAGKRLLACSNLEQLWQHRNRLSPDTPIYIDVHMKKGRSGPQIGRELAEAGFVNLYLQTGSAELLHSASKPAWIKDIVSKDPPWA